jgi:hypothetical protein
MFFFEKKNQKTFDFWASARATGARQTNTLPER